MILRSDPNERQRIALAYREAQELIAGIPKDKDDPYPRIVACFQRSDACQAAEDIAGAGWMLAAIQERVNERNLPDWRKLRNIITQTVKLLLLSHPTVH
ncbi:hypothetical protein [Rhizobium sp. NPDC090279]|uniref:hypothetical protein n=1 Tax=Rhizobium sp. NPDC090279 TaxID=3364499 RepID=UPI00383B44F8